MSITLEDLKEGDSFFYGSAKIMITDIEKNTIYYSYKGPSGMIYSGFCSKKYAVEMFTRDENAIILVGFVFDGGGFVEYSKGSSLYLKAMENSSKYVKVSERTIEREA